MNWEAPYRWSIATASGIIPGPSWMPEVPWQYVYARRQMAESWAKHLREPQRPGIEPIPDARAVPIPFVGVG